MAAYLHKFLHQFQHLEIRLEEIKSATDNFNADNCIGVGGYGRVYKGEVSHYRGRSMVAIKRLSSSGGQGTPEFLKEITTLSRYSHENLISLVGYCCQGEEMILVYELASRGSLDRYLNSPHLKWSQRIKICLDAAKGLSYLHDPGETHQRLIHCDIKSGNILLDDHWNAKLSDLGLSIVGSANEYQSVIVTLAAGTLGYIDPEYMMTHTLTKESDVYSFGVLLFEVLCGTLCCTRTQMSLVPTWTESYKQNKLNDIIFKSSTVEPLDQSALKIFSDIAYRCLNEYREVRPMMTEVITEIKTAHEMQDVCERVGLLGYEEMTRSAEPPLNYSSKYELWQLLMKGVLLNDGKTWFSLNKMGEHCEMISIAECLDADTHEFKSSDNSRFAVGHYFLREGERCKVHVKTQFLSPGITYTMDLVLRKTELSNLKWVSLKYKLEGETETSNSKLVYQTDDDGYWWMLELYQFTSDQRDHEIVFEFEAGTDIDVEGIDFRPAEHTNEKKPVLGLDENWEEKLPAVYEEMLKEAKDVVHWTTKKEAYSILRKGFFTDSGLWFSLDNDGNACILAKPGIVFKNTRVDLLGGIMQSSPESRFGKAFECGSGIPDIDGSAKLFGTPADVYLVYKLPKELQVNHLVLVVDQENNHWYIYLVIPETPVIRAKADQNTHNPMKRAKIKGLPRQRDDGWMEVLILEARDAGGFDLKFPEAITGLVIQGFEFKFKQKHLTTIEV